MTRTLGTHHVIAVANLKGGVGKTTTVLNLAGFAGRMGKRVLAIDTDPQGSLTRVALPERCAERFAHRGLRTPRPVAQRRAHTLALCGSRPRALDPGPRSGHSGRHPLGRA